MPLSIDNYIVNTATNTFGYVGHNEADKTGEIF